MKVNLNIPFTDCFGREVKTGTDGARNIAEHVCLNLFNISQLGGAPLPADKKYMAHKLCKRIAENPGCVELSTEEATFIKEVSAEVFNAGGYGQIVDAIENC